MTLLLVLLLAALLVAVLGARPGVRGSGAARTKRGARQALSPYWLLGVVLFGLILLRFGVNWLVVAGGMLVALLRNVLPLLRLLPLIQGFRRGASSWGPQAGPGWSPGSGRSSAGSAGSASSGPGAGRMTREEALQILGLDERATQGDVQREYRRLMRKVHPDLGGSSYLAAKLNEAKDVLS